MTPVCIFGMNFQGLSLVIRLKKQHIVKIKTYSFKIKEEFFSNKQPICRFRNMCYIGETLMSEFTAQKAKNLIYTKSLAQIDNSTYQIKSSSAPDKSYVISNGICECKGYRFRKTCSHVQAVKMMQSNLQNT